MWEAKPFLVRSHISASYINGKCREDCCSSLVVGEKWSENQDKEEGNYSKQEMKRDGGDGERGE